MNKKEAIMKAIVYDGMQDVKVKSVIDPSIEKSDDIIIKVTSTAICGSDLHLVHGLIPNTPKGFVLGHETMGIVMETGKDVHKVKKGDRVVVPFPVACGHCWYCEHELYSQCDNSNDNGETGGYLGYSNTFGGYAGGQAEYLRVPYGNVGPTKVPEELSDEQLLFLTDILPTSYWGVDIGGVKPGDTVVVLGCGPVGLLSIKWATYKGAKRIIAVDRVSYRLKHAYDNYGVEVLNFEEIENTGEYIKEITGGGADVVLDCVGLDGKMSTIEKIETALKLQGGSKSAIEIATQAVRKGGTVVLVGVYGLRYNNFPLGDFFSRNITLKMGQCPAQAYVEPILKFIKENKFDATDIITHKLSLDDGKHAYEIFDKKEDNCIKVILKP
jgi:S-(hydroxymethyl)glutathione dehydrogenase/alcohol dehydrogenase